MSDKSRVKYGELIKVFGISRPMNDAQINSVKVDRIKTDKIVCTGETYLLGPVMSPMKFMQPVTLNDGNQSSPSFTFTNNINTGIYRLTDIVNGMGFVVDGITVMRATSADIITDNTITSSIGDLKLSSAGSNIDFGGKNLTNYGNLVSNPYMYDIVGNEVLTIDNTPTVALNIPLDLSVFTVDLNILGTMLPDSDVSFTCLVSIKNPTGSPTVALLRNNVQYGPNTGLSAANFQLVPSGASINVVVIGINDSIKWRVTARISKQSY